MEQRHHEQIRTLEDSLLEKTAEIKQLSIRNADLELSVQVSLSLSQG